MIASGSVSLTPPVVTTSDCGPAEVVGLVVNVALIEVAELTVTLLTVSIPLGTVTVSSDVKAVLTPVMVTVICVPSSEAKVLGLAAVNRGAVGGRVVVSLNRPRMMNDAICPRVTRSLGQ